MRRVWLATALAVPVLGWCGVAAAQPVTGLYIGAAGGANFMQREQLRVLATGGLPLFGSVGFKTGYTGLGSVGWGFGNGLRAEIEGDYRQSDASTRSAVPAYGVGGRERKYGGMANLLFDLDIGSPYIYPYIGGGVGYQDVDDRYRIFSPQDEVFSSHSEGAFAYQAIAGLSFPIPPVVGLSATMEYRYMALAGERDAAGQAIGITTVGGPADVRTKADYNHSLMLGLRYAFDVAPPPPPAAAQVTPPPAAVPARTYLVFFDWDRADLTPRARLVVQEAARATTRVQVTRIEVDGYTDTSGTASYNQGLSVRRADAVANELVRDGVPRAAISVQGFGETHLLVPTANGVREPQNRRVEIILH